MNPCEELRGKLLYDLQAGVSFVVNGERKYLTYDEILKSYCTNTVPRNLFLEKYKSLPQIEDISQEEKSEWRKFVNEVFPGTTPQFRLEALKIIFTIATLSENEQASNS